MRRLFVLLFSVTGFISCIHEDLWERIKEDAEADWKALKEGLSDSIENVEKGVKEDWDVVKDTAKEDWEVAKEDWKKVKDTAKEDWEVVKDTAKEGWKMVKEEAEEGLNKLDLDGNQIPPSKVAESEKSESKEERTFTQDYVDLWERNILKESKEDPIATEDASVIKCSNLCYVKQSADRQDQECKNGCISQKREFEEMQEKFQKTDPSLLIGSSLDRCWEGCQSKPQCIDGCNVMRTLQISELKRVKEQKALLDMVAKDAEVEKKENEFDEEATDKEEELRKTSDAEENDFFVETPGSDGSIEQPRVWTYVLWRPSFSADDLPSLTREDAQESYAQMIQLIKSMMGGWEMSGDEARREGGGGGWLDYQVFGEDGDLAASKRGGWRDDRMQLKLPEETAAALRRSEGDGSFYSKLTQSLGNVKEQVEKTFRAPGFQQDLYYILIGLSGFLLITTAMNSVFSKREERSTMEDHYFLNGKTAGAKLPTYEDCIKADRELVMDITEQENYTKKNLALPTFVVLEPVAAANISEPACVHTPNSKLGEEKDENVA